MTDDMHITCLRTAFLAIVAGVTAYAQNEPQEVGHGWTFSARSGWNSRYVSEGRDNLEEGGLVTFETAAEKAGYYLGAWYGIGDSEDYDELNLFGGYSFGVGAFEAYVGYARLEFPEDDESDNELGAGAAYAALSWVTAGIDWVYSTEADGSFVEVSLCSEIALLEERITLCPYILEGFDFGYATSQYDGPNNLQVGMEACCQLSEHLGLSGYVAHSWAHGDVEREGLGDICWAGIGISLRL